MPFDAGQFDPDTLVLIRAREIVAERWRTFDYGKRNGRRCAAGAIHEAYHDVIHRRSRRLSMEATPTWRVTLLPYITMLAEVLPPEPKPEPVLVRVTGFNDTATQAEVIAAFDRAIGERLNAATAQKGEIVSYE